MQVDDDVAHFGVIDGFLRPAAPGFFGGGIVGEDTDDVELFEIDEIEGLGVLDATAHDEVKLLHGKPFAGKKRGPIAAFP